MFTWSNGYVYFSYYCDDGRCRASIGVPVSRKEFKDNVFSKDVKALMARIKKVVEDHISFCGAVKKEVLKSAIKRKIDVELDRKSSGTTDFVEDWKVMIEGMRSGDLLIKKSKKRYTPGTIGIYEKSLSRLEEFSKEEKLKLEYSKIDEDFIKKLNTWCIKKRLAKNTIALLFSHLRAFLNRMNESGILYTDIHKSDSLRHSMNDGDPVALTQAEIWTLYNIPLTRGKERARDVFVFGCGVGLRVDDLMRINDYHLIDGAFEFLTAKNSKKVLIPLHWLSQSIYNKYHGKLPVFNSAWAFGKHLHGLCRLAGITEKKLIVKTNGGVTNGHYVERCDLVSPHTMRRSFATNAILSGIPDRQVMEITGHESMEAFKKYVRITQDENKKALKNHPFFTGKEFLQGIDKIHHTVPVINEGLAPST